jgi:hypothetical protein
LNIVDIASRLQDVDVSAVGSWDAKIARAAMFSPYEMGRFAMERRDFRLQKWGGLHDKESWYNIYIYNTGFIHVYYVYNNFLFQTGTMISRTHFGVFHWFQAIQWPTKLGRMTCSWRSQVVRDLSSPWPRWETALGLPIGNGIWFGCGSKWKT